MTDPTIIPRRDEIALAAAMKADAKAMRISYAGRDMSINYGNVPHNGIVGMTAHSLRENYGHILRIMGEGWVSSEAIARRVNMTPKGVGGIMSMFTRAGLMDRRRVRNRTMWRVKEGV